MPRHGTVSKIFGGRGNGTASKNSPYSQHCGPVPKGPNWPEVSVPNWLEGPVPHDKLARRASKSGLNWPDGMGQYNRAKLARRASKSGLNWLEGPVQQDQTCQKGQ